MDNTEGSDHFLSTEQERQKVIQRYHVLDLPRLAIEAANVGTWIIDEESRVFIASRRVKELFGYKPEEDISFEGAMRQIQEKYRTKVIAGIEEAISKDLPYHMDYPVTGFHDQKLRWVKAVGGLYKDPEGKFSHFSGVMMDITDQKEKELRKNKFIGMVSHELKTPLTTLKAYVQMLHVWARKQKDSFTIGTLTKVEKQVKKMSSMINGFLNLSQVESGKIHLLLQDFELSEVIREAIEETSLLNSSHFITFRPCKPVLINADRDKIEQVIINLLSNAIKYSPKGTPVIVNCEVNNDMVTVGVKDEGMGMKKQDIKKLFERYYRVESKDTEKIPGFGIGLYLCSEIIKHHHGQIWVESKTGEGSTFFFRLPLPKQATDL
ncbi:MAG: two-component system, OmpR family, sensor histidine kinase VicK [Mucilaginibacter sp.]|nr:two-component system, OmpR family, sensor histidine kinase VicK [Mucilaginibacter sp.]